MARKDDLGRWIDAKGDSIPAKYVDPVAKKRDAMVEKLHRQALKAQEHLRKFKQAVSADIGSYLDWLATTAGEEKLNPGGNYSLDSFSGDLRVTIKVNKVVAFDERLQLAKQKIDRCAKAWSVGANENLQVVVSHAFSTDKKGNVDTSRILGLRNWKIKDPEWQAAMDLITEAITITGTREYLLFQTKPAPDAEWKTIRLDLAGV
jgi:hypothetical protein